MKLTIDTADIGHRIRRAVWSFFQFQSYETECVDCGRKLTTDERTYYERTCERCESINFHRFEALEREHMGDPELCTGIYYVPMPSLPEPPKEER